MRSTFSCIRSRSSTAWWNSPIRSVVAQLGAPDMRTPIAHLPRLAGSNHRSAARLDLAKIGQLTFEAPDFQRFPGLRLAYDALRTGRGATHGVSTPPTRWRWRLHRGQIRFGAIARLVEATNRGLDSIR